METTRVYLKQLSGRSACNAHHEEMVKNAINVKAKKSAAEHAIATVINLRRTERKT